MPVSRSAPGRGANEPSFPRDRSLNGAVDRIEVARLGPPVSGEHPIPDIVIRRLPVYVRTLQALRSAGVASVSSDDLAGRVGVTAAQIRRDLSYFGRFGKQGKGYDTEALGDAIAGILKLDRQWDVALAGFGNLGRAVAQYRGFLPWFRIAAIFDYKPEPVGQVVDGITVFPTEEMASRLREAGILIGIIAVPAAAAQEIADQMIAGGVRAILNYAPVVLHVPEGVKVRDIDAVGAMQSLTYYLPEPVGSEVGSREPEDSYPGRSRPE